MSEIVSTEGNEGCEASGEELLPGIPNFVTLAEIVPNLSWRECLVLSRVSRGWYHAIQSRQVYHARVRSNSTETIGLLGLGAITRSISMYHIREKFCSELPPIPRAALDDIRPFPLEGYQCVALDGKIYVLGGNHNGFSSDKVFVLDVAGQRKWELCAPMRRPRSAFGCGVIGGRIYVCGGISSALDMMDGNPVRQLPCDSEVYDPKRNTWSSIKPMIELRKDHSVETVGEELLAHGGFLLDRRFFDSTGRRSRNCIHRGRLPNAIEVYNPGKDEWRVLIRPYETTQQEVLFGALGKFFSMKKEGHNGRFDIDQIHVQGEQTVQTHLYSFSFAELLGRAYLYIVDVLPVDDELLVSCISAGEDCIFLLKSIGFGNENKELTWHLLPYPSRLSDPELYVPFVRYPLKL